MELVLPMGQEEGEVGSTDFRINLTFLFVCLFVSAAAKLLQSCPTLCDPIDGSYLGSSVPGILQARILEWVAISFSRGSS